MSSRPKRYRKTKDPDPTENQNLPIDENEETNSIRSNEEAVEEHKSNTSINNNAKNDDHDQSSNKSGGSSGKNIDSSTSVDPPGSLSTEQQALLPNSTKKKGKNKATQVSDHNSKQSSKDPEGSKSPVPKSPSVLDPNPKVPSSIKTGTSTLSSKASKSSKGSDKMKRDVKENKREIRRLGRKIDSLIEFLGTNKQDDSSQREVVDLPPVSFTAQGHDLITAPVMFKPKDTAFWRYSGDMMRRVEIIGVDKPTDIRKEPVYTVKCIDNGQQAIVTHYDIFVAKDVATSWDQVDGRITSDMAILTATDRMDLYAIEGAYTADQAVQWANLDASKFKLATLQTALKDVVLESDSLMELKNLHDIITSGITGASTTGLLTLPSIHHLSPTASIRSIWLPPARHAKYPQANACYMNIARVISIMLTKKDFAKSAPKAKFAISSVAKIMDGIDILNHLYKARFPMLGASDFDPYVEIMSLKVEHGMLLIKFITSAQDIEAQLQLSSHPSQDNTLYKHFLQELMKTNVHQYVSTFFSDFNRFNKAHGGKEKYTIDTIDTVSRHLIDGKAPDILVLNDKTTNIPGHDVNQLTPYKEAHIRHKSRSTFSRPKFAAMQATQSQFEMEKEVNATDDASIDETTGFTEEEIKKAEEMVQPLFERIQENYSGDLEVLHNDLMYNAMTQVAAKRVPCEICSDTHPGECWLRGPDFQPEWLRKRIEQINLRDGNKPKETPSDSTIPPRSTYSRNSSSNKKPLKFSAMHFESSIGNQAIESALDDIANELQSSIENHTLSTQPKMSSLSLPTNESIKSDGSAEDLPVVDMTVFNRQDFC